MFHFGMLCHGAAGGKKNKPTHRTPRTSRTLKHTRTRPRPTLPSPTTTVRTTKTRATTSRSLTPESTVRTPKTKKTLFISIVERPMGQPCHSEVLTNLSIPALQDFFAHFSISFDKVTVHIKELKECNFLNRSEPWRESVERLPFKQFTNPFHGMPTRQSVVLMQDCSVYLAASCTAGVWVPTGTPVTLTRGVCMRRLTYFVLVAKPGLGDLMQRSSLLPLLHRTVLLTDRANSSLIRFSIGDLLKNQTGGECNDTDLKRFISRHTRIARAVITMATLLKQKQKLLRVAYFRRNSTTPRQKLLVQT